MHIVNIHEAKTNFSKLIDAVGQGEEIVIAKSGKPAARLIPIEAPRRARKPGALKGRVRISDDFDTPLPEHVLAAFEGR